MQRLSFLLLIFGLLGRITDCIYGDDHSGYPSPSLGFSGKPISRESPYRYRDVNPPSVERPISPGSSYGNPGVNQPFPEWPGSPGSSYGYPGENRPLPERPISPESPYRYRDVNPPLPERAISPGSSYGYPGVNQPFPEWPGPPESAYRSSDGNQPLPERPNSPGSSYGYPGVNRPISPESPSRYPDVNGPFPESPISPGSSYRYPERSNSPGSSYGYPDDRRQLSELPKQTDSPFRFSGYNRLLNEKPVSQDCSFEGEPYQHGERVTTKSPCLNCTCTNKIVICSLTVCVKPTVIRRGCFPAKAPTECCATLICGGFDENKPDPSPELRPTFKPIVQFNQHSPGPYSTDTTTSYAQKTEDQDPATMLRDNFTTVSLSTLDNLSSHHPVYDIAQITTTVSTHDLKKPATLATPDSLSKDTVTHENTPTDEDMPSVSDSPLSTSVKDDDSSVYFTSTHDPALIYNGQGGTKVPTHHTTTPAALATPDSLSEDTVTHENTPTDEDMPFVSDSPLSTSVKDDDSLVYFTSTHDPALIYDGQGGTKVPTHDITTPAALATPDSLSKETIANENTPSDEDMPSVSDSPFNTSVKDDDSLLYFSSTHDPALIYDGQGSTKVPTHDITTPAILATPDSLSKDSVTHENTPTDEDMPSVSDSPFNTSVKDDDSLLYFSSTHDPALIYDSQGGTKVPTQDITTPAILATPDSLSEDSVTHENTPTEEDRPSISDSPFSTSVKDDYSVVYFTSTHDPALIYDDQGTKVSTHDITTPAILVTPDSLSKDTVTHENIPTDEDMPSVNDSPFNTIVKDEDSLLYFTSTHDPALIYDGQDATEVSTHDITTPATLATPDSLSKDTVTHENTPTDEDMTSVSDSPFSTSVKDDDSLGYFTSTNDPVLDYKVTVIDEISGGGADLAMPENNSDSSSHLRPFTFQHTDEETTTKDTFTVTDYPTDTHTEMVNNHSGAPNSEEDVISVTTSITPNNITSYPIDQNQENFSTPKSTEFMTTASLSTTQDNLSSHYPVYDRPNDAEDMKNIKPYIAQTTTPASPEIYDDQVVKHNIKTVPRPATPDSFSLSTANYGPTLADMDTTSVSSTFNVNRQDGDSLVYITSTKDPFGDEDTIYEKMSGGCLENGTIYGDGSAMLSKNFCEYCFCIRGRTKCIKPVCNLSIEGCTPIYETKYSCCPSKYDCSQRITETTESEQTTASPKKAPKDCRVYGDPYQHGDLIPIHRKCHTCYCSNGTVNCTRVRCAAPIDGCRPIIPKGFCCPISFRCDYGSGYLENTKGAAYHAVKASTVANPNIKSLHRRLDEADNLPLESTGISVYEPSPVYIGESSTNIYDDKNSPSDTTRENDKTLNIELKRSTDTILDTSEGKQVKEALSQTTAFQQGPSSTEAVSVGPPVVHTLSIQELFQKYFSHQNVNTSKLSDDAATEPKRNNSKQPISIVEIYDSEPNITNSATMITTKLNTVSATNEKETSSNESRNEDTSAVTSRYTDSLNGNTRIPNTLPITYYEQGSSFYDEKKTENGAMTTIFPNTETQNTEEFHTRTDNEPTYPAFTTTGRSNEFQGGFSVHPALTSFASREDLTDHDILETTLSQILAAASELYNEKFNTHPKSPEYATTKPSLSEELKIHTEARPVVLIYDNTRNFETSTPTLHSQTSTYTDFLRDTTRDSSDGDDKTNYETQSPDFMFDTTQNAFSDHSTMESSSLDITTRNNNQELKTQSETRPTTPIYTTNINKDRTTAGITANSGYSEQNKEETASQQMSMTHLYHGNSNKEHSAQANVESTYPTFTTNKDASTEDFVKEKDQTVYPVFTSTKYLNIGQTETNTGTNPTRQTTLTPEISTEKENKVAESVTSVFLPAEHDEGYNKEFTTVNIPLSTMNKQKDPVTTESAKLSTRINSKLPSFSYVEKVNEKNGTSVYPQNPVLTDSVVTVYLPADQERVPDKGNNFTNVGAVYIGAPLSVGGADSQKGGAVVKTKITQSGGVIFMDPQYTDINTKNSFRNSVKGANPAGTQNWGSTALPTTSIPNPVTTEKEPGNNEKKKGPRIQDAYNQSSSGQGYKIIPFVAEDAVRGHFGKINNTLVVQQGSTEGLPDIVSDFCFIKGRIYMNGEMIGKPDPCELCRCFYGRELCQIQRCPTPPDCIPEKIPGFCCPRFTCGNNATSNPQVNKEKEMIPTGFVQISEVAPPPSTRKPEIIERIPPTEDKEIKFGIRVRTRPTPSLPIKQPGYTEHKILSDKMTTIKPEIRTFVNRASPPRPPTTTTTTTTTTTAAAAAAAAATTSKRPNVVHRSTSMALGTKTTTTTTTASPLFPDPWGLLKVSGCNIYGKYYKINDQVEILSGPCSHCICTSNGVDCNDIC